MRRRLSHPKIAAFEFLSVLLVAMTIIALSEKPPVKKSPQTYGAYAVIMTWPTGSNDDMDLWVEDPLGNICYFDARDVGFLHLETDDRGTATSGTVTLPDGQKVVTRQNSERTIIKRTVPGEYTVNVQYFQQASQKPIPVTVSLWSVSRDTPITKRTLTFTEMGQEKTMFRFKVDAAGNVVGVNRLPKTLEFASAGVP